MEAICVTAPNTWSLVTDYEVPKVKPGSVLVRVHATGVCGTDIEIIKGEMGYYRSGGLGGFPIVPGHEWAGEVAEVGEGVQNFKVGDHVVGETTVPCWECECCSNGLRQICPTRIEIGVLLSNGGFAQYLVYPDTRTLHKIRNDIAWPNAASCEPLAISVAAVNASPLRVGDLAVVFGDGPIGLYLLQVLKAKGAKHVIVVGGVQNRLEKARALGADTTVNALTDNNYENHLLEQVLKFGNGKLADLVMEATGNPRAVEIALEVVKPGGQITLSGLFAGRKANLDVEKIVVKNLRVCGVLSSPGVWPETIALIESGKVDPSKVISHKFPLAKFGQAVETLEKKLDNVVKVVITLE